MKHNNWTPWGDKEAFYSLLVENSMLLDQTHNSVWKDVTRLHGKDISLTTPRSLLAHQLHYILPSFHNFVSVHGYKILSWKGPVTQWGSSTFGPAGIHTLPSTSGGQPGLIGTFGTSAGRAFHAKPSPQNSPFPIHQGYRRKALL